MILLEQDALRQLSNVAFSNNLGYWLGEIFRSLLPVSDLGNSVRC